jgi:HAD superfamily hydrolase (TIGR01509 family)
VRVPRYLPGERGHVRLTGIEAVTLDFGGTLVHVDRAGLRAAARVMALEVAARLGPYDLDAFLDAWGEERERQFREDVPRFREVDLEQRFARVLARLRGLAAPAADVPWDDAEAARRSDPGERRWAVDAYSRAFVAAIPPAPEVEPVLARLAAAGHRLAILSNWPLATTLDTYVERAGWARHLSAVVVSERVGTIKPHPAIFAVAATALGDPSPSAILHVGDDWAADVVGAKSVGWRAAYLPDPTPDSPFPDSPRDTTTEPDVELERLSDLEMVLAPGQPG